jgi:hypothetical protein
VGVVGVVCAGVVGVVVVGVVGVVCAGVVGGVVGVVGGAAGAAGGVTSVTETIVPVRPGIEICSTGVPGGTSTVTVSCEPPASVTRSVRGSAEAEPAGRATATDTAAAVKRTMGSFRLIMEYAVGSFPVDPERDRQLGRRARS